MQPHDIDNESSENSNENPMQEQQIHTEEHSEKNHQIIFEQTFNDLMNKFGEQCNLHNVECAIAIAKHPDYDEPMVFYRAHHIVDAASMMAKILKQIKTELYNDLNTEES